jgi:hypothetical protein
MTSETASLILDGEDVPLRLFEDGVKSFRQLLDALSKTISGGADIEWVLDRLDTSSAITRVRAQTPQPAKVAPVVRGLMLVGRALQVHEPVPYGREVRQPAEALTDILNGRVTSLRIETSDEDVTIRKLYDGSPRPATVKAFGAVMGRIQTLSSRGGYAFTLYDAVFDKAVSCYLQADQEDWIRDKWDRRAIVEGLVSRDPETDRPLNIRSITAIEVLPEPAADIYLPKLSDLPVTGSVEDADALIRRLRDAW